jgi:hypothetical protein
MRVDASKAKQGKKPGPFGDRCRYRRCRWKPVLLAAVEPVQQIAIVKAQTHRRLSKQ